MSKARAILRAVAIGIPVLLIAGISATIGWRPFLEKWGTDGLGDYAEGSRTTFLMQRR